MISRRAKLAIKLSVIATGVVCGIASARNYTAEIKGPPPELHSGDYCLKCHSDAKTIQRMNEKAGEELFHVPAGHPK